MITLAAVRRALSNHRATEVSEPAAGLAAVALVLQKRGAELDILLIRRAERAGDPWSGHIAFPGGRHNPTDSGLLATAVRETLEETGVDLQSAERLGALDDLHPRVPHLPSLIVRPFVFAIPAPVVLDPGPEVQRAFWVSLDRLTDRDVWRDVTMTVRGEARTFKAYTLSGETVWGMTERILTPFLQLVSQH